MTADRPDTPVRMLDAVTVSELFDPDYMQFSRGLRDFGMQAQNADVALVYFAGHGVQVDHENYLLPIDANLQRERDLLYEGVPLTERTSDYSMVLPDRIVIYRRAILEICETEDEVVDEVRTTVVHEIGHHFGIVDERLHELGW